LYNIYGLFCYSVYSSFGYFEPHNKSYDVTGVELNDLIYTYHATFCMSL